ncbi:glycosyltransferase family 2 protein [Amycolatopsis thermophila]|uniref:Glycosyltransferase involved in cell wall biosynthesis n=1 Tax=Amycolatopsis thermophila TaxID=206084 RepID=A0ABU0F4J1_9PSEU|nr:glycosyltransferase family 2 protein [Amycolatopsis thermophila]MDQ0381967.1 glycosyltransferase involved in cell wall biosynthesis [Amycolatopsis thermophila]
MSAAAVSVCIPAYQAGRYLADTVRSVLAQTLDDVEVVVLDNASTDETPDILRGFTDPRLRVLRNDRVLPLAENWNRVVAESRGRFVKLVCADDLLHPDCVRRQYEVLASDPAIALVCARRDMINEAGEVLAANRGLRGLVGRQPAGTVIRKIVRHGGNPLGEPGGALFRREQFDAVGGFDARWKFPMDLALWIGLLGHGDFVGQRESLAAFRVRRSSLSARAQRAEYAEQRALSEGLASDPGWGVRPVDRLVGAAMAPGARLRRQALFLVAKRQGERG